MLRILLKLIGFAVAAFVACTLCDALYRFYDLRNAITYSLRTAALESDQELRKKMVAVAIRSGIRCEERDILIERSKGRVRAEFPYRHWVGIPFGEQSKGLFPLALRASGERAY
jgi:hypothetical protein